MEAGLEAKRCSICGGDKLLTGTCSGMASGIDWKEVVLRTDVSEWTREMLLLPPAPPPETCRVE